MARRSRLDAELVRRGLARSREQAAEFVRSGRVRLSGQVASKAATAVLPGDPILVTAGGDGAYAAAEPTPDYASRGGHKLAGALSVFLGDGLTAAGRRCLDAGASTGGFTDVLLRSGAAEVIAVDVGYGQLAWRLRTDDRVTVVDRTNVRYLELSDIGRPVDVVVADLSFISLVLVLPALVRCATADADYVLMVKPQFEVGRQRLGGGGVVRDQRLRAAAVRKVADAAAELGLGVRGITASSLPGPSGNVEYFLWLRRDAGALDPAALDRAIADGPSGSVP